MSQEHNKTEKITKMNADEAKEGGCDSHSSSVTITVTSDDIPPRRVERRRMSSPTRLSEPTFHGISPTPLYARGRRASGARLGSEERVRKISFGIGGVPKSGSWGSLPADDAAAEDSDSEDSLLLLSSRRLSSFVLGPTLMGYNRRQWLSLMVFAVVDFCSAAVISLQAPFYPPEAVSKGASAIAYASVFFSYEFTIFIMCPVFGKLFGHTSSKLLFNTGVFMTSTCVVMFGFLCEVNDVTTFIMLSIVIRIFEGIGSAASTTAKYSIISVEFPQNAASTFASLEKFYFLGCIIAPPLAGIFIEADGFILPFSAFGLLLFGAGLFTFFVMPSSPELNVAGGEIVESCSRNIAGFGPILKIPSVALALFCILGASCSVGFLNVSLEQHIHKWNFSAPIVASMFILSSGFYSISALCWAWFRDKINNSKYIMLIGSVLIFNGFLLIGPAPLLPIHMSTWFTCIGLITHGIGLGACIVSGYMLALHKTIENGFADNVSTFGLISAIFTSVFSFGQMLGCSSAGILHDTVGFRWGTCFILILQLMLMTIVVGFIIFEAARKKIVSVNPESFLTDLQDEGHPLLRSSQDSLKEKTIHEGQIFNPEVYL